MLNKKPLPRGFYLRDANLIARELLGKCLVHVTAEGTAAGIIVETEAYVGTWDKGAHSYPMKRTPRTKVQFGPGGFAYVYGIYGMHFCFNVVTNGPEVPEVVLVRALEPVEGIPLMESRRGTTERNALCSGPGKLCQALGITKDQYGLDLTGGELFITPGREIPEEAVYVSPRINIEYAEECAALPWRYYVNGNSCVSRVPARYTSIARPFAMNEPGHLY